jgi:hypothetical protein
VHHVYIYNLTYTVHVHVHPTLCPLASLVSATQWFYL